MGGWLNHQLVRVKVDGTVTIMYSFILQALYEPTFSGLLAMYFES